MVVSPRFTKDCHETTMGMDTKQVVARFEAERQALDAGMTLGAPASRRLVPQPSRHLHELAGETPALPAGRPYFVMELVRGIKITDYCDQANCTTKERLDASGKPAQAAEWRHKLAAFQQTTKAAEKKEAQP
jgi:hypothetical protein